MYKPKPVPSVAKSDLPSPLKSPTATERGLLPTVKLVAGAKLPVPVPNSTETLLLLPFATAKSDLPSPLKSPDQVMSGCIGALDGLLLLIQAPSRKEASNAQQFFSGHYQQMGLNVQALVDSDLQFL